MKKISFEHYLEKLREKEIEIEDNRNIQMGIWIKSQPFELAKITFSFDMFGINMVGTQLFDVDRMNKYKKELSQSIEIVQVLNSYININ